MMEKTIPLPFHQADATQLPQGCAEEEIDEKRHNSENDEVAQFVACAYQRRQGEELATLSAVRKHDKPPNKAVKTSSVISARRILGMFRIH